MKKILSLMNIPVLRVVEIIVFHNKIGKIDINANNSIYIKKDDLKEDDSYENTKLIGINDSMSDLKKNLSKTEENNSKEFFIDNELLFKTKKDKEETSLKQIEEKQIINTQDLKINMNNDSNKKIYLDSDICKSNNDKTKNTKNIKIDKEHDKDINPSIKFVEEIAPNNPEINKTNDKNKQIIKNNREVDIDVNEIRKIDNNDLSSNQLRKLIDIKTFNPYISDIDELLNIHFLLPTSYNTYSEVSIYKCNECLKCLGRGPNM